MTGTRAWRQIAVFFAGALLLGLGTLLASPMIHPADLLSPDSRDALIFFQIRLPRLVLAFLTGAALSLAGANFQALLKNPLADPYILGVSGGSALGYIVALVFGVATAYLPATGFLAALVSMFIIQKLATTRHGINTFSLLLTGVIFNSFSFALILIINTLVPFAESHQILSILMGSIAPLPWSQILVLAVITISTTLILGSRTASLNLLCLGESEAHHLGLNVQREKILVFTLTSLLVGASVSLCGLIGFVGLFVPHLLRLLLGADHKNLVPLCFFAGGLFLATADFLVTQLSHWEQFGTRLPVGAITALVGAPLFVWLLKRQAGNFT